MYQHNARHGAGGNYSFFNDLLKIYGFLKSVLKWRWTGSLILAIKNESKAAKWLNVPLDQLILHQEELNSNPSFLCLLSHSSGLLSCVNMCVQISFLLWLQCWFIYMVRGAADWELEVWCLTPCIVLQLEQTWGAMQPGAGVSSCYLWPHHFNTPASSLGCYSHPLLDEKTKHDQT